MLQTLKQPESHSRVIKASSTASPVASSKAEALTEQDDGLTAAAGPIMMGAYGIVLLIAVLTFKGSGEALLSVAVAIAFGAVFFGVPLLMMRIRAQHDTRWRKPDGRDTDTVDTYTGRVGRAEAVVHMVIVPVVVSVAFACFAIIWALARP